MTEDLYGEGVDGLERSEHSAERLLLLLLTVAVGTERLTAGWDGESGDSSLGRGEGVCHDMVVRSNDTCGVRRRGGTALERGRLAAC